MCIKAGIMAQCCEEQVLFLQRTQVQVPSNDIRLIHTPITLGPDDPVSLQASVSTTPKVHITTPHTHIDNISLSLK